MASWLRSSSRSTTHARRGVRLAGRALALVSGGALMAGAAVPAAPSNILVFPNRDFVTVEGFADHAGQTATLELRRGGSLIGSAQAVVSGGAVAFEVNHPGGVCWGNGTALNVTPDIQAHDVATVTFGGKAAGDAIVQDGYVDTLLHLDGSTTVTLTGPLHLDAGVDPAN